MRFTVAVASGPGTSGYDKMTPKQREKFSPWAQFKVGSYAESYAEVTRFEHPTWIVKVIDNEMERYNRQQAAAAHTAA